MYGGYAVILLVRAKRAELEILAEKAQLCGERKVPWSYKYTS
jgi:hypothetical protein